MNKLTDTYTLSNGIKIPCVGFGTWQSKDGDIAYNAVKKALEVGYRHIDTAAIYGNEASVGRAIKDSGIAREELFITTKLWNDAHGYDIALKAFETSMEKLQLDYIDLYLIHWPNPKALRDSWQTTNAEAWRALEKLYADGKARAIGVSNFHPHHLNELYKTAKIKPMVNQIKLCPGTRQEEIVDFYKKDDILLEAYSPFGTGKLFDNETMKKLASKYDTTIAKLALRWSINHGFLPLPKSVTAERIASNIDFFDIDISSEDMNKIDGLKDICGPAPNPDTKDF